jgi:hypothetical protein
MHDSVHGLTTVSGTLERHSLLSVDVGHAHGSIQEIYVNEVVNRKWRIEDKTET